MSPWPCGRWRSGWNRKGRPVNWKIAIIAAEVAWIPVRARAIMRGLVEILN